MNKHVIKKIESAGNNIKTSIITSVLTFIVCFFTFYIFPSSNNLDSLKYKLLAIVVISFIGYAITISYLWSAANDLIKCNVMSFADWETELISSFEYTKKHKHKLYFNKAKEYEELFMYESALKCYEKSLYHIDSDYKDLDNSNIEIENSRTNLVETINEKISFLRKQVQLKSKI
jgi:hypothetical protein